MDRMNDAAELMQLLIKIGVDKEDAEMALVYLEDYRAKLSKLDEEQQAAEERRLRELGERHTAQLTLENQFNEQLDRLREQRLKKASAYQEDEDEFSRALSSISVQVANVREKEAKEASDAEVRGLEFEKKQREKAAAEKIKLDEQTAAAEKKIAADVAKAEQEVLIETNKAAMQSAKVREEEAEEAAEVEKRTAKEVMAESIASWKEFMAERKRVLTEELAAEKEAEKEARAQSGGGEGPSLAGVNIARRAASVAIGMAEFAAFNKIIEGFHAITIGAAESVDRLDQFHQRLGVLGADANVIEHIDQQVTKLGASTGVATEKLREASLTLQRYGADATANLELAANLSERSGKSIEQIAEAIGKMSHGVTGGLSSMSSGLNIMAQATGMSTAELKLFLGISQQTIDSFDKLNQKQITVAEFFEKIRQNSSGAADAMGDTMKSKMQELENAWDHMMSHSGFGRWWNTTSKEVVGGMKQMIQEMEDPIQKRNEQLKEAYDTAAKYLDPDNATANASQKSADLKKQFDELTDAIMTSRSRLKDLETALKLQQQWHPDEKDGEFQKSLQTKIDGMRQLVGQLEFAHQSINGYLQDATKSEEALAKQNYEHGKALDDITKKVKEAKIAYDEASGDARVSALNNLLHLEHQQLALYDKYPELIKTASDSEKARDEVAREIHTRETQRFNERVSELRSEQKEQNELLQQTIRSRQEADNITLDKAVSASQKRLEAAEAEFKAHKAAHQATYEDYAAISAATIELAQKEYDVQVKLAGEELEIKKKAYEDEYASYLHNVFEGVYVNNQKQMEKDKANLSAHWAAILSLEEHVNQQRFKLIDELTKKKQEALDKQRDAEASAMEASLKMQEKLAEAADSTQKAVFDTAMGNLKDLASKGKDNALAAIQLIGDQITSEEASQKRKLDEKLREDIKGTEALDPVRRQQIQKQLQEQELRDLQLFHQKMIQEQLKYLKELEQAETDASKKQQYLLVITSLESQLNAANQQLIQSTTGLSQADQEAAGAASSFATGLQAIADAQGNIGSSSASKAPAAAGGTGGTRGSGAGSAGNTGHNRFANGFSIGDFGDTIFDDNGNFIGSPLGSGYTYKDVLGGAGIHYEQSKPKPTMTTNDIFNQVGVSPDTSGSHNIGPRSNAPSYYGVGVNGGPIVQVDPTAGSWRGIMQMTGMPGYTFGGVIGHHGFPDPLRTKGYAGGGVVDDDGSPAQLIRAQAGEGVLSRAQMAQLRGAFAGVAPGGSMSHDGGGMSEYYLSQIANHITSQPPQSIFSGPSPMHFAQLLYET